MAKVIINDQEIEIGDAERLNGIQAAARAGVDIPHYCWHPGMSVVASCRMCLVESGRKDPESGEIRLSPKLVPACQTPAADGAVFITESEKVKNARAMVEEDLLLRHPVDCPICDKAGECSLQDYHFQHGQGQRRADIKPFHSRRRSLGDTVTLFVDRCVMCTRCVRFTREISGSRELMVSHRGAHEEIDVFPGFPLENKMSGNVVDLCPVGALGDKDFLYQQRVWFMRSRDSVCAGCSTGCSIQVDENQDRIYRLKPRENPHVNQWWMCDEGRYGWKYVHDTRRLTDVVAKRSNNGTPASAAVIEQHAFIESLRQTLAEKTITLVVSPFQTVESAYLAVLAARSLDPKARLAMGPIPTNGEDETFQSGFTIRSEKCPNRRGVHIVLDHLGDWQTWEELLESNASDPTEILWILGGYPEPWNDDATVGRIPEKQTVVLHDLFPSPLADRAQLLAPSATFAERDGSFVNAAQRLQSFQYAIRPPAGAAPEGRLLWRLLEREGLYNAKQVLQDAAGEILMLSNARGEVASVGVDLLGNQLA